MSTTKRNPRNNVEALPRKKIFSLLTAILSREPNQKISKAMVAHFSIARMETMI